MKSRSLVVLGLSLIAGAATAQQANHRTAVFDLTIGRHGTDGGFLDYRHGVLLDGFVAGAVRSSPRAAFVVGAGGGVIAGGFGDRCLIKPGGGCAPQANFYDADVLAGVDIPLAGASARVLVGPAFYNGADASSFGPQLRADLTTSSLAHLGLGLMGRATWLPSHGGESLMAWAIGGSVIIR